MCAAPKILHCRQSLMASRPGHQMRSISAILMESHHQCPCSVCCWNASIFASSFMMHSTRARPHMAVPSLNCHNLSPSIRYCDARCCGCHQSCTLLESLIANMASMTSANIGLSLKCSHNVLVLSSADTCIMLLVKSCVYFPVLAHHPFTTISYLSRQTFPFMADSICDYIDSPWDMKNINDLVW